MKSTTYQNLVAARKSHVFPQGIQNPAAIEGGKYDCDHIGAWSQWQHNLDADVLVIGQDWGDLGYFTINHGKDTDSNPTNQNLIALFAEIGLDIGAPSRPKPQPVFFTNAILGIKGRDDQKQMSLPVKAEWIHDTTRHFTIPLIKCIQPKIIITLGAVPLQVMQKVYADFPKGNLKSLIEKNPVYQGKDVTVYAFYHCGGLGLANRKLDLQKEDWRKVRLV